MKALVLSALVVVAIAGCTSPGSGAGPSEEPTPPIVDQVDATAADDLRQELEEVGPQSFTAATYKPGDVRHIVLFRFKPGTSAVAQRDVMNRFLALAEEATRDGQPYIVSIDAGVQNSGEAAGQDMKQGFIVTFASQGDRNYYVGQPIVTDSGYYDQAHHAFKDFVGPLLDGVVVFDFVSPAAGDLGLSD